MDNQLIARIEDLPYNTSPPIQFVYEAEAALALGVYTWNGVQAVMTPDRPIRDNVLYYFRNVSFSADISEQEYTGNIINTPLFQVYRRSGARVMIYREPLLMTRFMWQFEYRQVWMTGSGQDQIFGSFNGSLNQGPGLIGKTSVTLTGIISAQEIVDENFTTEFRKAYPDPPF